MENTSSFKPFWLTESLVNNTTLKLQQIIDDYKYMEQFYPVVKKLQEIDYKPQKEMIIKLWGLKEKYFRTRSAKLIGFPVYQDMHRRILELKETLSKMTYLQIYQCMIIKDYRESFSYKKISAKNQEKADRIFKLHRIILESISDSNQKANSLLDTNGLTEIDLGYFKIMEISEVKTLNDHSKNFKDRLKITLWNKFQKEEFHWIRIFIEVNRLKSNFVDFINEISHDREGIPEGSMFKCYKSILEYAYSATQAPISRDKKPVIIKPLKPGQDILIEFPEDIYKFNKLRIKPGEIETETGEISYIDKEVNIDVDNENDLMTGKITESKFLEEVRKKAQRIIAQEATKVKVAKRKATKEKEKIKDQEFDDMLDKVIEDLF